MLEDEEEGGGADEGEVGAVELGFACKRGFVGVRLGEGAAGDGGGVGEGGGVGVSGVGGGGGSEGGEAEGR